MTRRELMQRARLLSNARVQRFGIIPADAAKWWQQIEQVAADWQMTMTWEEWHSLSRKRDDQEELPL